MDLKFFPYQKGIGMLFDERYIGRKPIYEFIKENCENMRGTLLDYGAGKMPYRSMFKNVDKYIGLDYDVTATSAGYYNNDVLYYDGIHIPLDDESVDNVLCNQVLEHVDDVDVSLDEIYRVMKKGGIMLLTLPAAYPIHMEPYDFRRFTHYGIRQTLEKHGFREIDIKGSTSMKDTLRRLKLFVVPYEIRKIFFLVINAMYALRIKKGWSGIRCFVKSFIGKPVKNLDCEKLQYPLDYLIICKK